ncbi:MAG: DUF2304 domain-containing protein [Candidatus Cloacimonetes bacterium]|nr:DUF2304 domain-containing protein [Candidatus Cloacimonadota bacterium]
MGWIFKGLTFFFGAFFFLIVLRTIKRNLIGPSLAVMWIIVSIFLFTISIFEGFYHWISYQILGIHGAQNMIFSILIGFLFLFILYLSIKITQLHTQIQKMISTIAILEKEIQDNKNLIEKSQISGKIDG